MNDFKPGLEGVVAFQTEIAEPDRKGGALRYRGVDIEELVGQVPYEKAWGLLVDESLEPGMPDPEPYEPVSLTGSIPRTSRPRRHDSRASGTCRNSSTSRTCRLETTLPGCRLR